MRAVSALAVLGSLGSLGAACGSSPHGPPPAPPATAVIATPRLTPDDVEVARVNGRPVWASCVAAQATTVARPPAGAANDGDAVRRAALDQCVAFELLAQAAEARGLAAGPEVAAAARTAAVNRLVETEFEQRYQTPADLGAAIDAVMQRNAWRMHLIQLRASSFARFIVPKNAPPDVDARARALAEQLAGQLAGQTGLYPIHLTEAAQRIDAGTGIKLESDSVKPMHQDDLVAPYAAALYAIPAVGQASGAFRTQWGWDVALWTGGVEPKDSTRVELAAEMFPDLRRRQFQLWTTQLGKQLGLHIEIDQATVARLDTEGAAP
ncbi:MAG TPA: hypothetical protein VH165_02675 [Kofleriaceae bacterium]|nr:hypothetical protein [Kofleriaceae bacterium]